MKVTFLGTGTSVGVPRIGCNCAVCTSTDAKNKRLRCSIHIEHQGYSILVDTGPDLRTQAITHNINTVDAVLFTHEHADHLHGLDDVRCYCFDRTMPIPCYGNRRTIKRIEQVFDYAFASANTGSSIPQIELVEINEPFEICGLSIEPITVNHGKLPILAFRIGDFAYVTDTNDIPKESLSRLQELEILVIDALRYDPHPTHFNIEQALATTSTLQPQKTYFTHIAHDLDHHSTNAILPHGVELAYDGMVLEVV